MAIKKTLELKPTSGEMLKPRELIELEGTGPLTLQDRRVFNALVNNAWGKDLGNSAKWFEIPTGELREDATRNYRLADSIERLMRTIVVVADGETEKRTALLSSNSLEVGSNRGVFRYKFTEELAELLKDSTVFAKLDLSVMRSFRSKYAFSLYEAVARRIRLRQFTEEFTPEALRTLLGVEDGKLKGTGNLNKFAIQTALIEVNAISPFQVSLTPKTKGKKVLGYVMGWNAKSEAALKAAYAELQRHSAGRGARTTDSVDVINT
jgi:hypothetical protein